MKFIKNTNIYIGRPVVIFSNNQPIGLGHVTGGTGSKLEVTDNSGCIVFNRVKNCYVVKSKKLCLYFLGEAPYQF